MTSRGQRGTPLHQNGLTLIELMVSLTIGLIVAMGIFSAFIGASGASKMTDAQSRMNEDAQAALLILSQQLKMAGNNPDQPDRIDNIDASLSSRRNPVYGTTTFLASPFTTSDFSIRGCDGQFSNVTSAPSLNALDCPGGANSLPDSIAINYEADSFNTVPTSQASGKWPTDCVGKKLTVITATLPKVSGTGAVSATVTYSVAENRFYVGTSTSPVSTSLYCKGNGEASTPQALVENVEDMQITYGASSPAPASATIAGYLPADELSALSTVPNSPTPWRQVISVRICVLVRSEEPVVSGNAPARYLNCEGVLVMNPPDRRLRQAYFSTVVLRNRRL
ncbi:MAG: PilW family protein [Aeromicrobium sp.]|nr:PilW family protein [Burkholderiales bacterium]